MTGPDAFGFVGNEDLGTFGGLQSEAWDVNDESGTVGWAHNSSGLRRGFYIQIGGVSLQPVNELPRLAGTKGNSYNSEAYGVNRFGQVVGKTQNDAEAWRAFLCRIPGPGTTLTDLTTLPLDGGQTLQSLGWTLTSAVAVNNGGVIIGTGTKSGVSKAWIQCAVRIHKTSLGGPARQPARPPGGTVLCRRTRRNTPLAGSYDSAAHSR